MLEPLKKQSQSWKSHGEVLEICFWKRVRTPEDVFSDKETLDSKLLRLFFSIFHQHMYSHCPSVHILIISVTYTTFISRTMEYFFHFLMMP